MDAVTTNQANGSLRSAGDRFQGRMNADVLPLWSSRGFLWQEGLFCEQMSRDGQPILDVPYRLMVQARQIFVFSDGARTGLFRGAEEQAQRALDRLLTCYSDDRDLEKGLAFSIDLSGRVVSPIRDSYAHAFAMFALAAAYRLTRDPRLTRDARALLSFIETNLWDSQNGGLYDRAPDPSGVKLQNPLMHLLEACLAAHEAWPDGPFLERAEAIVLLFGEKLFRRADGVLFECYGPDWNPLSDARFFEPGHHFEWIWLLDWYDRLAGTDHDAVSEALWSSAIRFGVAHDYLCFDKVGLGGSWSQRSSRSWPHTEGVKASLRQLARGRAAAVDPLAGFLMTINQVFLDGAFPGGWMDRVDATRNPASEVVPASTLYHLYGAFREMGAGGVAAGAQAPHLTHSMVAQ